MRRRRRVKGHRQAGKKKNKSRKRITIERSRKRLAIERKHKQST